MCVRQDLQKKECFSNGGGSRGITYKVFFNLLSTQTFIKTLPIIMYEAKLIYLLRWWYIVLLNVVSLAVSILQLEGEMSPYRLMCLNPLSLVGSPTLESLKL